MSGSKCIRLRLEICILLPRVCSSLVFSASLHLILASIYIRECWIRAPVVQLVAFLKQDAKATSTSPDTKQTNDRICTFAASRRPVTLSKECVGIALKSALLNEEGKRWQLMRGELASPVFAALKEPRKWILRACDWSPCWGWASLSKVCKRFK